MEDLTSEESEQDTSASSVSEDPQPRELRLAVDASATAENVSGHRFRHEFVCIEYPGLVHNEQQMLKTLGGIDAISETYNKKNRRLELRFRPDDIYCKPACGNKHPVKGLVLKVKVRHRKNVVQSEQESDAGSVIGVTVLGQVNTTYKFRTLCDFQYIPTDGTTCIYKSLVPEDLPLTPWLFEETEYFLPPPAFSRMDTVQLYVYRKEKTNTGPSHIIGCTRQRRAGHAIFILFDAKEIPTEAKPQTLRLVHFKSLEGIPLNTVRELFESRPVWSKCALVTVSGLTKDHLKYLLPCVAYYFVAGPWRVMWVRFGYDPRKDVTARQYQTLDFRLRTAGGLKTKVKAKRNYSNYLLPYKSASNRVKVPTISSLTAAPDAGGVGAAEDSEKDSGYIFRPGMLPPSRQMFYQYCDIEVPEIQNMIGKLPLPQPGSKCHERYGWMPPGLDDQCRDIINNLVLDKLKEDMADSSYLLKSESMEQDSTQKAELMGFDEEDDNYVDDYEEVEEEYDETLADPLDLDER